MTQEIAKGEVWNDQWLGMENYNIYFKKLQSFSNEHNTNKFSLLAKCAYVTLNDTHRKKLGFTQFRTRMAAWLFLTFFMCLHNQLSSIHSIKDVI